MMAYMIYNEAVCFREDEIQTRAEIRALIGNDSCVDIKVGVLVAA